MVNWVSLQTCQQRDKQRRRSPHCSLSFALLNGYHFQHTYKCMAYYVFMLYVLQIT